MRFPWLKIAWLALSGCAGAAPLTADQLAQLPPPANHSVSFAQEIKPIIEASCLQCHGRGRDKGGFRFDNRETVLKGGDSGPVIVPGKSADSLLIHLVQGFDPDNAMPRKGTRLTPQQIGLLRAWIDQGAPWDAGVTFGRLEPANLKPRRPELPPGPPAANPIDRFLAPYFAAHKIKPPAPVEDRVFARRVYLDVIGLLPPPEELERFASDRRPDKRALLVRRLLEDGRDYAEHWLTFWNDLLRNDYRGTGYIDGGRKQITAWLFAALATNMPYDQFVADLVNPDADSEGFTRGIVWRGVVNASQTPQMQTAQNISQVFMGVNLKCASCHDSFVNDLTLADAYGLAGIYADGPLEMVHCDKPTGKTAALKFLYPELGVISPEADKPARLKRLAEIITQRPDGRLTRTLVNRFWQKLMGHGLVEPVDDMEKPAWQPDLLDWLAEDFADHNYDLRHLLERILTSAAYQLPAVNLDEQHQQDFVFRGPAVRRMSAEQFRDALTSLTGIGYSSPATDAVPGDAEQKQFTPPIPIQWIWNDPGAADKAKAGRVYFRRSVQLEVLPTDATALVICDNSFTLFVNGHQLGSGSDFQNAFVFDLRPWLKTGTNLFAVEGVNHLPDNSLPTPEKAVAGTENPAGLLFYARLRGLKDGAMQTNDFATDPSWRCSEVSVERWEQPGFDDAGWAQAVTLGDAGMVPWRISKGYLTAKLAAAYPGKVRAALVAADPLMVALGRPNREQVVTTRPSAATTLQALELTNGETMADVLKRGAERLLADSPHLSNGRDADLLSLVYHKALGRAPTSREAQLAHELLGQPVQPAGLEDLLWTVAMLPEFQLIY